MVVKVGIPLLAITLLGCIAPFFGTIEFLLQSHRRKLAEAEAVTS